uniref:Uncharacterized protein n=1 Tax=Oryza punctata TaxID=4537 RepID=A0A0E0K9F8_ORYPU
MASQRLIWPLDESTAENPLQKCKLANHTSFEEPPGVPEATWVNVQLCRTTNRTQRATRMYLEPDFEVESGAAVAGGVEEAERDAAVHPAAHQHRHPQRCSPSRRAPQKALLPDIHIPQVPGAGAGARRGCRGGRDGAKRPPRQAGAEQRSRVMEERAPYEERTESGEGGDRAQHRWRRLRQPLA